MYCYGELYRIFFPSRSASAAALEDRKRDASTKSGQKWRMGHQSAAETSVKFAKC